MKKRRYVVLHEYGAGSHYLALSELLRKEGGELEFYEFRFLFQLLKGVYRLDVSLIFRAFRNFKFLISLVFGGGRGTTCVIGMAPYDWRAIFMPLLLRRGSYYLHSSWPFWDGQWQPKRGGRLAWNKFVDGARGAFFVTSVARDSFLRSFPDVDPRSTRVVYHSIRFDYIGLCKDRLKFRACGTIKKVVYVGRIDESKGVTTLIEMSKKMKDIEFHFVGGTLAYEAENVVCHGFLSRNQDLVEVLVECDVLLLPSKGASNWHEAFGMVIIEGLCAGLYPIVSDHEGPKEIVSLVDGLVVSRELSWECELLKVFHEEDFSIQARFNRHMSSLIFSEKELCKRWDMIREI